MSMTLNLIDRLLAKGRDLQRLGRERDALHLLRRLARFRELPAEAAEETQARLAELRLGRRQYHRARRHLSAALRYRPDCARYHYLLATAIEAEDTGDPRRAARHYRRSLQLDPSQPECLIDYGLLNIREGRTEAGLTCLRRAVELAPADVEAVNQLATGLIFAERRDEARDALRAARFRNPRDARFRRLYDAFQFQQLAREQKAARRKKVEDTAGDGLVLLPFVGRERTGGPAWGDSRIIRPDGPAPVPPPHGTEAARPSDQKHAQ